MLPTKFQVSWRFSSGEEAKNRFSWWPPRQHSWISDRNELLFFFFLQVTPMLHIKFQVNLPFGSGVEAKKMTFQDCRHGGRQGFQIETSLAFLDLQVNNASYQVLSQLAQGCSRLLKQMLALHDVRLTTDDGHWPITISHFKLRWAKEEPRFFFLLLTSGDPQTCPGGKRFASLYSTFYYFLFYKQHDYVCTKMDLEPIGATPTSPAPNSEYVAPVLILRVSPVKVSRF